MSTLLSVEGVSRKFGGLLAVDAVNMDVQHGEVHGLIGPNGAGKTTLLNLLSGHLPVSSGRIQFAGTDITALNAERRAIAGIRRTFQNLKLFKEMTVLENVMVGLHAATRAEIFHALARTSFYRREEAETIDQSHAALAFVGLGHLASHPAGSLPYGHQRLLEIARAFVARPRLLLLDEPAAGLNGGESRHLVTFIQKIREAGTSIILIEHHMDVVMPTCDRITVLNYGKLLARGTPSQIRTDAEVIGAYLGKGAVAAAAALKPAGAAHVAH